MIETWASWRDAGPPFVLEEDRNILMSARSARHSLVISDWSGAFSHSDFGAPGDTKLHLGLLPEPFCGNVLTASIYILLLNPGLGPTDYFGEYNVPEFRSMRLRNLRQDFSGVDMPFYMLDPRFSWHGGFAWWHNKLAGVIQEIARRRRTTFAESRRILSRELASVELLPYHSASFRDGDKWLDRLPSVAMARNFLNDVVIPRVLRKDAIVVVTRQTKQWNIPAIEGTFHYSGGQTRGAHLSPNSLGGKAILHWLNR